uniref:8.9 kDa family member n=1 Tax=Rhipicephalus appendiculatus TaxID=34631 RepID=A0A131Z6H6_RHIAP
MSLDTMKPLIAGLILTAYISMFLSCTSADANSAVSSDQSETRLQSCPVKYDTDRKNCIFLGDRIPAGESKFFDKLCVVAECSSSTQALTLYGCPNPGVDRPCEGSEAASNEKEWPKCCRKCIKTP